jgi:putative redox protein
MDASVKLDHGMTFIGQADSGFQVQMGTDPAVGGEDDGLRPMELLLISLGGCTGMDVISILRKMKEDVVDFEVKLSAGRQDSHPKVFTTITVRYIVRGRHINPDNVARAVELSAERYCPAQAMLAQSVAIEHTIEIIEEPESAA